MTLGIPSWKSIGEWTVSEWVDSRWQNVAAFATGPSEITLSGQPRYPARLELSLSEAVEERVTCGLVVDDVLEYGEVATYTSDSGRRFRVKHDGEWM